MITEESIQVNKPFFESTPLWKNHNHEADFKFYRGFNFIL